MGAAGHGTPSPLNLKERDEILRAPRLIRLRVWTVSALVMDQQERDNWKRIMEALAASGDTESAFYRRAKAISEGEPDPMVEMESPS